MDPSSTETPTHRWALPALAAGVISISFAAIFFRKTDPTHPLVAAGVRLAIASIFLAPWAWRRWKQGLMEPRVLRYGVWAGLLYGLHFGAWVSSLVMTSVAASVTIVTSTPLILAGFALVTGKDRPRTGHWVAMGLALLGLSVIGAADLQAGDSNLIGDILAFVGAIAMAGYLLLARSLGPKLDPWAFTGIATTVGAISLFVVGAASGIPLEVPTREAWFYLCLAALIPQLVGHTSLTWALRYMTPTAVGLATVGEPVGSTFLAWIWLGEGVSPAVFSGCSITIIAVAIGIVVGGKSATEHRESPPNK